MKIKIPNAEVQHLLTENTVNFPKYTTQLMNLANSNSKGTAPKIVGQMSELIKEFEGNTFKEWAIWYQKNHPDAIEGATEKILGMIENLKKAIELIDKDLVHQWVEDLVLNKTFSGLRLQDAIIRKLAKDKGTSYRLATKLEESKGIDGYIGSISVSVKPISYDGKLQLSEERPDNLIIYDKKKNYVVVEFDF
jgi:MjaI restriction endonuclease